MFLEACRGSGAHSSWPARAWCLQDRGIEISLLRCSALFTALKIVPTWCPKLLQSCIPIGPTWSQKGAKRKPKWCQHGSWRLPGAVQDLLRRPLSSWRPLGMLLESCWLQKNTLDRLLEALGRIPRQLSAIIGTKRVPKWTPGGGQNGVQNRVWLKMPKSLKL